MILGLKPYSPMKDSGVFWLGDVPEHRQVLPSRAVFVEVKERDHPDADMLSVTITKGVIRQETLLEDSSKKDGSNLKSVIGDRPKPSGKGVASGISYLWQSMGWVAKRPGLDFPDHFHS